MEYRQLGRSGLRVSAIGLGGNPFGRDTDEAQTARVIHHALDLGINFFDSADVYSLGVSEQYIGKALAGARRQQVIITSKVSHVRGTMGDQINARGLSRKHILNSVEGSLRRFGTDYIDLYQMHSPDPTTPLDETLRTLDDLVTAGKIRYVGASNHAAWQLLEAVLVSEQRHYTPIVSMQSRFNLQDRGATRGVESDVFPVARKYGVGIIAFGPRNLGILTCKYRVGEDAPADSRHGRNPKLGVDQFVPRVLEQAQAVVDIAREYGRTGSQIAIAWVLAHPEVATTIAGATKPEQLDDNVQAVDWKLTPDILRQLDAAVGLGAPNGKTTIAAAAAVLATGH